MRPIIPLALVVCAIAVWVAYLRAEYKLLLPDAMVQVLTATMSPLSGLNPVPLERLSYPEDAATISRWRTIFNAGISFNGRLVSSSADQAFAAEARRTELSVGALGVPVTVVYPETAASSPPPLIVYFHGGGFVFGEAVNVLPLMLSRRLGAVVATVDYPLAPETQCPDGVLAAFEAFEHVAARPDDLGFDPARIAIAGESAGGGMSAAVTQLASSAGWNLKLSVLLVPMLWCGSPTRSAQLNAGMYALPGPMITWLWQMTGCHREEVALDEEKRAMCSPLLSSKERLAALPRTLIFTASADGLRDEGRMYAAKLREAGVDVEHHEGRGTHTGAMNFDPLGSEVIYGRFGELL